MKVTYEDQSSTNLLNDHSSVMNHPKKLSHRRLCCIITLFVAIFFFGLAIPIFLLYKQNLNLSQQLQSQILLLNATNQELKALNQSFLETMSSLNSTLDVDISLLNESLVSLNSTLNANISLLNEGLASLNSTLDADISLLNESLASLNSNLSADISLVKSLSTPSVFSSDAIQHLQLNWTCQNNNYTATKFPGLNYSFTSENGGYGICQFYATYFRQETVSGFIQVGIILDGLNIANATAYYVAAGMYGANSYNNYLFAWNQNIEFSAGNHTLDNIAYYIVPNGGCTLGSQITMQCYDISLECSLYGL